MTQHFEAVGVGVGVDAWGLASVLGEDPAGEVGAGFDGQRDAAAEAGVDLDDADSAAGGDDALEGDHADAVVQGGHDAAARFDDGGVLDDAALGNLAVADLEALAGHDAARFTVEAGINVERHFRTGHELLNDGDGNAASEETQGVEVVDLVTAQSGAARVGLEKVREVVAAAGEDFVEGPGVGRVDVVLTQERVRAAFVGADADDGARTDQRPTAERCEFVAQAGNVR